MHFIFVYQYFVRGGFGTKIKCTLKIQSKSDNPQRLVAVRKFRAYEIFWIYSIFVGAEREE